MNTEVIESWDKFQSHAGKMILWGFRGQQDACWELETTLHRIAREYNVRGEELWHREYWMLRQFIRRAHHYYTEYQLNKNPFEWLALMQHHGAPTRLLDFSHSMYIAAFFALENATKDSAVWALNINRLRHDNSVQFGFDINTTNIDQFNTSMINEVNSLIPAENGKMGPNVKALAIPVEPEQLHERLMNQQGFFLFPNDMQLSVEENISSNRVLLAQHTPDSQPNIAILEDHLIKYIIPFSLRKEILKNLQSMNISARTLFHGLDGFARSMRSHVSLFSY